MLGSECSIASSNAGLAATKGTISQHMGYTQQPAIPPIDFDAALLGIEPDWIRVDVLKQPGVANYALTNVIFVMQRHPPPNKRIMQSWICPRLDDERWSTPMLGLLLDMLVPPLESFYEDSSHNYFGMAERARQYEAEGKSSYSHPAWASPRFYPTVNMSVDVKRQLPPEVGRVLSVKQLHPRC